jgi:hypothetical protein
LVYRRKTPLPTKSKMVMNILPVLVPNEYYSCKSVVDDKKEIYRGLEGEVIPPFLFTRNKEILTFAEFDADNSLCKYIVGSVTKFSMKELQEKNPTFSSSLVNIHMRRMFWNKSLYRDPRADVLYFPMLNKTLDRLEMIDHRGVKRWVVKKILHKKDTKYHKVGEINFYFHRGVEVKTPTYWGESFVELIPRRYYTLDGEKWIEGEIRAKIDRKFRKPQFDRSKTRLGLMRFWKHILFDSEFVIPPEKWFSKFKFGNFVTENVNWSPRVIGRTQMRLWDYRSD